MANFPVRYDPGVETIAPDEAETQQKLVEVLRSISEVTFKHSGHPLRSVHAKSHGILRGECEISDGLPPELAQGVFAQPGRKPVMLRLSTSPGDLLPDSVTTPRGLAVKIIGVDGERLPGSDGAVTQDFLMVNGPRFLVPDAKTFLGNLKLLALTTDRAVGLKKLLSAALRGLETLLESVGRQSGTLKALGGQPETNILGETFYTQVPIRYGDYIAKLSIAPSSPELLALVDAPLNVNGKPDGLRAFVRSFFQTRGAEWEIRAQLCTDLETMPVEDASKQWPEDQSPYRTVARISVPPQDAWSADSIRAVDEGGFFSPWHGIAAHRPLGSIMRARRSAYQSSGEFRSQRNGCPMHEPRPAAPTQ